MKKEDATFEVPFSLVANRSDFVHALVAHFDVIFGACHKPLVRARAGSLLGAACPPAPPPWAGAGDARPERPPSALCRRTARRTRARRGRPGPRLVRWAAGCRVGAAERWLLLRRRRRLCPCR
jgi:hypothetical protein